MDSDHSAQRPPEHQQPSSTELFSSAKVVAEAAQSTFSHQSDKVDKTKVADAAGDLLDAARQYGKLDDKGMGTYVDKAEDYLHQYAGGGQPEHSKPEAHGEDHSSSKPEAHGDGQSGSGVGDYLKMAQGFLKK